MSRAGRKRKPGKRTKTGRLSRAGEVRYDKGTDRVQAMQELYGQDGADAIGRAFRSGLLGEGQDAKAMLDTSRRMSNAYWAEYENGRYACTLGDRNYGSSTPICPNEAREREDRLNRCIDIANAFGAAHRRNFDQLCIDVNPDCGPAFLDEIIFAMKCGYRVDISHAECLKRALVVLSEIAGVPCHIPDFNVEKSDRKRAA